MAFPTTSVLDDFNRADAANLGANWSNWTVGTAAASLDIASNRATTVSGSTDYANYYNVATYGADCEVYVTVSDIADGDFLQYAWVGLRLTSPGTNGANDGYLTEIETLSGTDNLRIHRIDNDALTQLGATISSEFAAGDGLGLEAIGTTIQAYKRVTGTWASAGSRTDATYGTAGNIGLGGAHFGSPDLEYDDFGGGTIGGAATVVKDMIGGGIIPFAR